jgi:hypothetical protein
MGGIDGWGRIRVGRLETCLIGAATTTEECMGSMGKGVWVGVHGPKEAGAHGASQDRCVGVGRLAGLDRWV